MVITFYKKSITGSRRFAVAGAYKTDNLAYTFLLFYISCLIQLKILLFQFLINFLLVIFHAVESRVKIFHLAVFADNDI